MYAELTWGNSASNLYIWPAIGHFPRAWAWSIVVCSAGLPRLRAGRPSYGASTLAVLTSAARDFLHFIRNRLVTFRSYRDVSLGCSLSIRHEPTRFCGTSNALRHDCPSSLLVKSAWSSSAVSRPKAVPRTSWMNAAVVSLGAFSPRCWRAAIAARASRSLRMATVASSPSRSSSSVETESRRSDAQRAFSHHWAASAVALCTSAVASAVSRAV